jgi:hypothetical protein
MDAVIAHGDTAATTPAMAREHFAVGPNSIGQARPFTVNHSHLPDPNTGQPPRNTAGADTVTAGIGDMRPRGHHGRQDGAGPQPHIHSPAQTTPAIPESRSTLTESGMRSTMPDWR